MNAAERQAQIMTPDSSTLSEDDEKRPLILLPKLSSKLDQPIKKKQTPTSSYREIWAAKPPQEVASQRLQ